MLNLVIPDLYACCHLRSLLPLRPSAPLAHCSGRSQGAIDGAKAAEASNVVVAAAMGVQRGGTVGIELGFYRGISAAWAAKGQMYVWGSFIMRVPLFA